MSNQLPPTDSQRTEPLVQGGKDPTNREPSTRITPGRIAISILTAVAISAIMFVGITATLATFSGENVARPPQGVMLAVFLVLAGLLSVVFIGLVAGPGLMRDEPSTFLPPPTVDPATLDTPDAREMHYFERMEFYRSALARHQVLLHRQRLSRDRFLLHSAVLIAAGLTALIHQTSGSLAAKVISLTYPAGTSGQSVPWYLDKLQTLLLIPFTAGAAALAMAYYCSASRTPVRASHAAAIGGFGMLLAGLLFVLQVSPELLGLVRGSGYTVTIGSVRVPFDLWLLSQRLLLMPIVGWISALITRSLLSKDRDDLPPIRPY